jgi:catechol 2,3-dioxygenase-like lactoylglutathione lyase family enzyme
MSASIRLTHITFAVPSLEEAIEFFSSFFNFSVALDRRPLGGSTVWLSPEHEGTRAPFVLVVYQEQHPVNRLDHLGLQCDSVEAFERLHARFQSSAWAVTEIEDTGSELGRYFEITGPGGHHIEVTFGQDIAGI